jgi:hypothetical protein
MPITSNKIVVSIVVEQPNNIEQQINEPSLHNNMVTNKQMVEEPQGVALRRFQRERRSAISDEYVVYLQESDFNIGSSKDPISFSQALKSVDSTKWMNAMKDELKSIDQNEVWDLVELPEGYKKVGCSLAGSTRPNATLRAISNDLKLDLWPKVSLRKKTLITKKPSPMYPRRTHLESLWLSWLIMIWSYIKWM